jgi:hypothetical protein
MALRVQGHRHGDSCQRRPNAIGELSPCDRAGQAWATVRTRPFRPNVDGETRNSAAPSSRVTYAVRREVRVMSALRVVMPHAPCRTRRRCRLPPWRSSRRPGVTIATVVTMAVAGLAVTRPLMTSAPCRAAPAPRRRRARSGRCHEGNRLARPARGGRAYPSYPSRGRRGWVGRTGWDGGRTGVGRGVGRYAILISNRS